MKDDRNPTYFSFLSSSRLVLLQNMSFCLFLQACLKILHGIFYVIRKKHTYLMTINNWLSANTKWWLFLAIVV